LESESEKLLYKDAISNPQCMHKKAQVKSKNTFTKPNSILRNKQASLSQLQITIELKMQITRIVDKQKKPFIPILKCLQL